MTESGETAARTPVAGLATLVRPATDDDIELLVRWYADPETSRYWDDETFTAEQMHARLRRPRVDAWIVEAGGEPVGYLQSWWEPGAPRRGGLDGFLVPAARGSGLMSDAASALARSLLGAGWQQVTVDPSAWNERALRGWADAGFVEVSRHDADGGHLHPWVLMRFAARSSSNLVQERNQVECQLAFPR
jgi:RimJ/RimL family protein N-acetyltransferase